MTYKEALINSLDKVEDENIEMLPICFPHFILSIGAIMATQIAIRNAGISGASLAHKLDPLQMDFDSIAIGLNTHGFISWLLEQPIPESDDGEIIWYDVTELQRLMNIHFFGKE